MSNSKEIKSGKIFIKQVFKMWFCVPEYQRPYVWNNDQLNDFVEDISYASTSATTSDYFLGSIVFQERKIVSDDGLEYIENDLLDGQQRLTTLFLLASVARDITKDTFLKNLCQQIIFQQANPYENIPEIIRIQYKIRKEVEEFIDDYIKIERGTLNTTEIERLTRESSDPSVRNMASAILFFHSYFSTTPPVSIESFLSFLLNKVLLIYVSSEELEDAFRLFTILNDRGVKLRNSDILKAKNLKALPTSADVSYWAAYWEELEGELNEDFDRFMSWIRTIIVKEKARLSLLKEFDDVIYNPKEKDKLTGQPKLPLLSRGLETFKLIKTYNDHYSKLFSQNNHEFTNSWEFDNLITTMNIGLASTDWIPVLLCYYNKFKADNVFLFLKKLDNKFSGDWIGGYTPTERIENMNRLMKAIENATASTEVLNHAYLKVDADNLLRNLEAKVYGRQFARYILLKLDYHFLDNRAVKLGGYDTVTIEHILPQNPKADSRWVKEFSQEERDNWTNKLGNLIILGARKNTSQGRLDYAAKKEKYFKNNINTFANSARVISQHSTWNLNDLAANQETVISILKGIYEIPTAAEAQHL